MAKRMLIDATHPEETRVAVVSSNTLEEYDYENITLKQIKSNIYLVKVTRVEPSLQAAFVDFGGNRHGFLPFPEVHPDYYRIPIADREALLAEERALAEARAAAEEEEEKAQADQAEDDTDESEGFVEDVEDDEDEDEDDHFDDSDDSYDASDDAEDDEARAVAAYAAQEILYDKAAVPADVEEGPAAADDSDDETPDDDSEDLESVNAEESENSDVETVDAQATEESEATEGEEESVQVDSEEDKKPSRRGRGRSHRRGRRRRVQNTGGDMDEHPRFHSSIKRRYKIQEVIKRNQVMLIQISKEERGNKGAAVTTYISLPGRYCVLMPNSPHGGGVSRKVSSARDRQRLKQVLKELNVPEGMSVILRTAGVTRSKAEIKRDLDYLLRLWDEIREMTLQSTAPELIYEEGNLIKRSIRDLYRREIDEILVSGEAGYKLARDFMKTLMPSHARKVQQYKDDMIPLFHRYQVESQIDAIHSPTVHMKSGGYIVINPTEALVAIDVNSGRATKGRHIEETALKTNLEAAEEIARQLRLRDLGGLVVVDFIDMEDRKSNRIVERKMRDAMADDRARVQLGRISAFGLMELSRQRMNPSLVEMNFETCSHCEGVGLVRTVETSAVMVLRALEEEALRGKAAAVSVTVPTEVSFYIFNNKRDMLSLIETRYNMRIVIDADESLHKPHFNITVTEEADPQTQKRLRQRHADASEEELDTAAEDDVSQDVATQSEDDKPSDDKRRSRRRGRRGGRRRGGRNRGQNRDQDGEAQAADTDIESSPDAQDAHADHEEIAEDSSVVDVPLQEVPNQVEESVAVSEPSTPSHGEEPQPAVAIGTNGSDASLHAAAVQEAEEDVPPRKQRSGWWRRNKG